MSIGKRLILSVIAAGSSPVLSYIVAEAWIWSRSGFGRSDLAAFWYWNALFGCGVFILATAFLGPIRQPGVFRSGVLPFALGAIYGFAYTLLNRAFLGPWFGAWSFPVLYCWVVGGALGLVFSARVPFPGGPSASAG